MLVRARAFACVFVCLACIVLRCVELLGFVLSCVVLYCVVSRSACYVMLCVVLVLGCVALC